jgi:hypothetical protein
LIDCDTELHLIPFICCLGTVTVKAFFGVAGWGGFMVLFGALVNLGPKIGTPPKNETQEDRDYKAAMRRVGPFVLRLGAACVVLGLGGALFAWIF